MSTNVVHAESLSPKAKLLSQRIQSIVSPFLFSSSKGVVPIYCPGITISCYMQGIAPSVLRKTVLEFILQNSSDFKKNKEDSWIESLKKEKSFFSLINDLLVELPFWLWENGQKKEALEVEKWSHSRSSPGSLSRISRGSLSRDRLLCLLLLCNESIPKTVLERYSKDSRFLKQIEKKCSFYGISFDASSKPDPDALLTVLTRLLKMDPNLIFFDSPDVYYPDLVKKVFLKMKAPVPWSQEKIDAFKKKLSQNPKDETIFFSTTMPSEDLFLLWVQFLEKKIGSATLKAALTTKQMPNHLSEEKARELARRLSDLGFLYQNLKTPKMKEAFQLFCYAEKLYARYKIHVPRLLYMHLASMYCAGHGTSVDHQKGFEYFQKGFYYLQKAYFKSRILLEMRGPTYDHLVLFSTFIYWFDLPISNDKQSNVPRQDLHMVFKAIMEGPIMGEPIAEKNAFMHRNVSNQDLYMVFKAIMEKPVAVKNAFMQLYAQGLRYPWGTYVMSSEGDGPLFMWDLLHRAFHSCFRPNK